MWELMSRSKGSSLLGIKPASDRACHRKYKVRGTVKINLSPLTIVRSEGGAAGNLYNINVHCELQSIMNEPENNTDVPSDFVVSDEGLASSATEATELCRIGLTVQTHSNYQYRPCWSAGECKHDVPLARMCFRKSVEIKPILQSSVPLRKLSLRPNKRQCSGTLFCSPLHTSSFRHALDPALQPTRRRLRHGIALHLGQPCDEGYKRVDVDVRVHRSQTDAHHTGRSPIEDLYWLRTPVSGDFVSPPHIVWGPIEIRRGAAGIAQRATADVDVLTIRSILDIAVPDVCSVRTQDVQCDHGPLPRRVPASRVAGSVDANDGVSVVVLQRRQSIVKLACQPRRVLGDGLHRMGSIQIVVHGDGATESGDGEERHGAVLQFFGDLGCFHGVPPRPLVHDHIDRATAKVSSIVQRPRRVLAHYESSYVGKAEDFVERDGDVIGRCDRVGEIERRRTCQRCRIEKGEYRRLFRLAPYAMSPIGGKLVSLDILQRIS